MNFGKTVILDNVFQIIDIIITGYDLVIEIMGGGAQKTGCRLYLVGHFKGNELEVFFQTLKCNHGLLRRNSELITSGNRSSLLVLPRYFDTQRAVSTFRFHFHRKPEQLVRVEFDLLSVGGQHNLTRVYSVHQGSKVIFDCLSVLERLKNKLAVVSHGDLPSLIRPKAGAMTTRPALSADGKTVSSYQFNIARRKNVNSNLAFILAIAARRKGPG
jgi:hypothetical protein